MVHKPITERALPAYKLADHLPSVSVSFYLSMYLSLNVFVRSKIYLERFSESKYLPHPPDVKFFLVPLKEGLPANELDNQKSAAFSHLRKQGSLKVICESCFDLKKLMSKKYTLL